MRGEDGTVGLFQDESCTDQDQFVSVENTWTDNNCVAWLLFYFEQQLSWDLFQIYKRTWFRKFGSGDTTKPFCFASFHFSSPENCLLANPVKARVANQFSQITFCILERIVACHICTQLSKPNAAINSITWAENRNTSSAHGAYKHCQMQNLKGCESAHGVSEKHLDWFCTKTTKQTLIQKLTSFWISVFFAGFSELWKAPLHVVFILKQSMESEETANIFQDCPENVFYLSRSKSKYLK